MNDNLKLPRYKIYANKTSIQPSNVFFDTSKSEFVVEYSKCKNYFRIIKLDATASIGWVRIESTSVRTVRGGYYVYLPFYIKFKIWT